MVIFETVLALLLVATVLSMIARKINVPYPALLAVGGAIVAFIPGGPRLQMPPEMILALFVAPILLDSAYDTSLRDLRSNAVPIASLVLIAVGLTTAAVAITARWFFPDLPWPAAIALGAIVSPPDSVAAIAILRQVNPPYRLRTILEGESLLNDASALLIYNLAVGAVVAGSFSVGGALPTFALVVIGSIAFGWTMAWPSAWLIAKIEDAPTSVIFQFVFTFAIWLVAEHFKLSAVVSIVVFGLTAARVERFKMPARLRIPTFAIWESVTFVLNVLAFTLVGLQLRAVIEGLSSFQWARFLTAAIVILAVVIAVRLSWAMLASAVRRGVEAAAEGGSGTELTPKGGLVVGWSGMRGIVTLAAALALPESFPERDFIQFAAFAVVLGTLLVQGLTLGPLVRWLRFPKDETLPRELALARAAALKATLQALDHDHSPAAERAKRHYSEALGKAQSGFDPHETSDHAIRRRILPDARRALDHLRASGTIGDGAFRAVEEELDLLELSSAGPQSQEE